MSEPGLGEKAAVMRCLPALAFEGQNTAFVQRFQVVRRDAALTGFVWISQHRDIAPARATLATYLAGGISARIFDLKLAEFLDHL